MKRLNATHKKILRVLRDGAIDSMVSIAEISGIRFGIVADVMLTLAKQGYVKRTDIGYSITPKGKMMADSLHEIRHRRLSP